MSTRRPRAPRVILVACFAALGAICLMVWSLVDPRPVPVVLAMSAGQALGTVSLAAFLIVVAADLRRRIPAAPPGDDDHE